MEHSSSPATQARTRLPPWSERFVHGTTSVWCTALAPRCSEVDRASYTGCTPTSALARAGTEQPCVGWKTSGKPTPRSLLMTLLAASQVGPIDGEHPSHTWSLADRQPASLRLVTRTL